ARRQVARGVVRRFQRALVVHLEERLAIFGRAPQLAPLEGDDRPADDRGDCEQQEDELGEPTRLKDQVEDVEARETYPPVRPGENQRHVPLYGKARRRKVGNAARGAIPRAGGRMKLTVDSHDLARLPVDLLALPLPSLS